MRPRGTVEIVWKRWTGRRPEVCPRTESIEPGLGQVGALPAEVNAALDSVIDADALAAVLDTERDEREQLLADLGGYGDGTNQQAG